MRDRIQIGDIEIDARFANSALSKARGHMLRLSQPDYALVFPFDGVEMRKFHMAAVPFALDAVFVVDGIVQKTERMRPWIGGASGEAEIVIEVPVGEVDVQYGDEVTLTV